MTTQAGSCTTLLIMGNEDTSRNVKDKTKRESKELVSIGAKLDIEAVIAGAEKAKGNEKVTAQKEAMKTRMTDTQATETGSM